MKIKRYGFTLYESGLVEMKDGLWCKFEKEFEDVVELEAERDDLKTQLSVFKELIGFGGSGDGEKEFEEIMSMNERIRQARSVISYAYANDLEGMRNKLLVVDGILNGAITEDTLRTHEPTFRHWLEKQKARKS